MASRQSVQWIKEEYRSILLNETFTRAKYRITNPGTACQFLGIQITVSRDPQNTPHTICLGLQDFITSILKQFNMHTTRGAATLMDIHVKLDLANNYGEREVHPLEYQPILLLLILIALVPYLTVAKHMLRDLKSTAHHHLHFCNRESNTGITGYTDSDWANDCADRKSQGGHIFILNNSAISQQLRKQDLVAMSIMKAEYIACLQALREASCLQQLQRDISGIIQLPLTPIYRHPRRPHIYHHGYQQS